MKQIIPKAQEPVAESIIIKPKVASNSNDKIVFSFKAIEKNEYFNLDSTCQNWASDLFETMKIVSDISIGEIHSGKYSRDGSTLRIHNHENVKKCPCDLPRNINLEEMWQIRISRSKGGIHGIFYENIFYIIWFDPLHNLYPDDRYGGLKKIRPPKTCCKDRDEELELLHKELLKITDERDFWENYATEHEHDD